MTTRELDTRGLSCPMPVLKARKVLKAMAPGERLAVLADDPKAPGDFQELCAATGWRLIESSESNGDHRIVVERA